jgi:hypothetical protein
VSSERLTHLGDPLSVGGDALFWRTVAQPVGLGPLVNSHEADDFETELKAAFVQVFEVYMRERMTRIEAYGMPHVGDLTVLERFVKAAGLALERKSDAEPYMRELFRAWISRNQRRGLAFLRHYLQLLWPGKWRLVQLWQDPALPYPAGASEVQTPGSFLTSRVRLYLELVGDINGSELSRLAGNFRSVVPARIVLEVAVTETGESGMRMAAVADQGDEAEDFTVTAAP